MEQTETVAERTVNDPAEAAAANPPEGAPETLPAMTPEEIYAAVAGKVRSDSQNLAMPIPVEELGPLFADLAPEQIVVHLTELVQKEEYADIKIVTSGTGAIYLYSETSITSGDAGALVLADETQAAI